MADAIISVVVERVAAIIEDQIRYEVNLLRGVEKELLDLSDKLETIKNVLDDAEKRGVKDQNVKNWLKRLKDTAYEMDDLLDEWNYALLKHKMGKQKVCCSFIPSSCLCFNKVVVRHDTARKIKGVKAILDQILKEKDDFSFVMLLPTTVPVPKSGRDQSTSSIELQKVHGVDIERNKNDIVRKLIRLDADTQIVSIVGMGGIGKTTLAQLVYNNTQVKDCFELTIWICVSDPFDVAAIARGIVESVRIETIPPNTNQLELVLEKLRDCISGKKFLLVLDDVWTEDYNIWEPLKINLKYGAPTSKILVTTRNERVAKMMGTLDKEIYRPQQLSDEECWSLMRRISLSGRSEEECREFEDVGNKIASKCKGLPLAANVLGSLLQFKNSWEEWENVWKSEIWQLEKAEVELFPHLVLSYNELSPALKHCFSYCAVYPKDCRINIEILIEEWMALGYLGSMIGDIDGVELKGREYFNNLAMRSLFQDFEESESREQIEWCKVHDIVHDFAKFVRKNNDRKRSCQLVCNPLLVSEVQVYRSIHWDKKTPPLVCDCLKSVRVLRFNRGLQDGPPQGMEKLIHLRWLDLRGTALFQEDLKIICRLYFLQTLLLAECSLEEIWGEIGNLVKLRHLDLSRNEGLKELPESMCSLLELQTLLLANCSLEAIPADIGNLIKLRHLDLSVNKLLKELPESMCSLFELQILNIVGCRDLNGLPQGMHRLQNLQHLLIESTLASNHGLPQGVGELSGLRTLELGLFRVGIGYNKLGLLKRLNRLTGDLKLKIHLKRSSDPEELVEDAREARLRNKIHIRNLSITFEDEMNEREQASSMICRLYFLQTLSLAECSLEEISGEIENLVQLRHLDLSANYKLKEIPESVYSLVELQTLSLAFCSVEEIGGEIGNLVHLRNLHLSANELLKELPESMCNLVELQTLDITDCSHLSILPQGIHKLQNLQRLLIDGTLASRRLPQGVGELSGLRTLKLTSFKVGSDCNKLGLLKKLNHLTRDLTLVIQLRRSSDVEELVEDAREAELRNKIHIRRLFITFEDEMDERERSSSSLWMDVIEALEPYHKLYYLEVSGYGGSRLPHWMSSPLNLIKEINLYGFSEVCSLPAIGKLPFLEVLSVNGMDELKVVGREFLGIESSSSSSSSTSNDEVVAAFPKLKKLSFWYCHKWEEWDDITAEEEEEEFADVCMMPCLTRLYLNWCEGLKKLPHRLLRKASSLQMLNIRYSSELEKRYGDDKEGSAWRSISQYNPKLQLRLSSETD